METYKATVAYTVHSMWSHWMQFLFAISRHNSDGSVTIPERHAKRWKRQMHTLFSDLPEEEKASDVKWAQVILDLPRLLGLNVEESEYLKTLLTDEMARNKVNPEYPDPYDVVHQANYDLAKGIRDRI